MPLFTRPEDRRAAEAIAELCYCNPFGPQRIELEKQALGAAHRDVQDAWSLTETGDNPNIASLSERATLLADVAYKRLRDGRAADAKERQIYEDLIRYCIYYRMESLLLALAKACAAGGLTRRRISTYRRFEEETRMWCDVPGPPLSLLGQLPHLFAILFQLRRAFHLVYENILGASRPAVRLRAAVWDSIFSHDRRRYQRALYNNMGEITTLITGPSGTGKELVARAVGMSRYIPFDALNLRFTEESATSFHALNISSLTATVVESELFGHRKGSFTGAQEDRAGWLDVCAQHGCLFLDEIGELDPGIQVKLLRVLQTRTFSRVGEHEPRDFRGKVIAATNRDLVAAMREGRFREDFYYRLCSDNIATCSLSEQLSDRPQDLPLFVRHAVRRLVGDDELEGAAAEVMAFIERRLSDYQWPGNVRELEQCVRSVLIRGDYAPVAFVQTRRGAMGRLLSRVSEGQFKAEAMNDAYITLVYFLTGNFAEASRRLGLDRRTVKAKLDHALLSDLESD